MGSHICVCGQEYEDCFRLNQHKEYCAGIKLLKELRAVSAKETTQESTLQVSALNLLDEYNNLTTKKELVLRDLDQRNLSGVSRETLEQEVTKMVQRKEKIRDLLETVFVKEE